MLKVVVGNKMDKVEATASAPAKKEVITDKMLKEFAMGKRAEYYKVSALKNQGIDEVF